MAMLVLLQRPPTEGLCLIRSVKWSPDGSRLAAILFERVRGTPSSTLLLWNLEKSAEPQVLGTWPGRVMSLDFCGLFLAAGVDRNRVCLWDCRGNYKLRDLRIRSRSTGKRLPEHPDIHYAGSYPRVTAAGTTDRLWGCCRSSWYEWDPCRQAIVHEFHPESLRRVDSCVVSRKHNLLLYCNDGIGALALDSGFSPSSPPTSAGGCERLFISRCGERFGFVSGSRLKLGNVAAESADIQTLSGHRSFVYAATFGADSQTVITGGQDGTTRVWNTQTQQQLAVYDWNVGRVTALDVSADGGAVVAGGDGDPTLIMWDLE